MAVEALHLSTQYSRYMTSYETPVRTKWFAVIEKRCSDLYVHSQGDIADESNDLQIICEAVLKLITIHTAAGHPCNH